MSKDMNYTNKRNKNKTAGKKLSGLFALMIVALLVFSTVPLAFAENNENNRSKNESAREKAREEAKELRGEIKENFESAKERYNAKKELFRDIKKEWTSAREDYAKLKTEDKANRTNATIEKARNYLLAADEVMINYLNMIKSKIQSTEAIPAEDKTIILSDIDADIAKLEALKINITNAKTRQELNSVSKEIKKEWQEIKPNIKQYIASVAIGRIDNVLEKSGNLADVIQKKIDQLKAAGADTAKLESLLADFKNKINESEAKRDQAREQWKEIRESEDRDEAAKDTNKLIKESNELIREAHKILKEILKELQKERASIRKETIKKERNKPERNESEENETEKNETE